jgi:hypothetical protein
MLFGGKGRRHGFSSWQHLDWMDPKLTVKFLASVRLPQPSVHTDDGQRQLLAALL